MPSTYTDLLRLLKQANGENSLTWGDLVNSGFMELVEDAIGQTATISLTSGTGSYTLTSANGTTDEARCAILKFTGSPTVDRTIIVPTTSKIYIVWSNLSVAKNITISTGAGTTVTLAQNDIDIVIITTGGVVSLSVKDILKKGNNLSDLASAATARTNLGLGTVALLASDTDGTLASNSDTKVATQKAVKTYADTKATAAQGAKADSIVTGFSGRVLTGLSMLNNATDAANDLDIGAGYAVTTSGTLINLASTITKRIDAVWAAGTNQGGLDTGTVADNTYYVWAIRKTSDGSIDVLFSLSNSSPSMPSGYSEKVRIGTILRKGGTILSFKQVNRRVSLDTPYTVTTSTFGSGGSNFTVGLPSMNCEFTQYCSTTGNSNVAVMNPDAITVYHAGYATIRTRELSSGEIIANFNTFYRTTSTTGTIRCITSGSSLSTHVLSLNGWEEPT